MNDTEPLNLDAIESDSSEYAQMRERLQRHDEWRAGMAEAAAEHVPALIAEVRRLRDRTGEWEYGILTVWTEGKEVADDSDWWGGSEREVTLASYERNRRDERFGNPWRSVVVRRIQAGPIERVKVSA